MNEFRQKRIFSLNLVSFIWLSTDLTPQLFKADDSGLFYAVFPDCAGVQEAIKRWRKRDLQVNLHEFLAYYKRVKELTRQGGK